MQSPRDGEAASSIASDAGQAAVELNDGAASVSAETSRQTSRRLACDSSLVVMHHARDGAVLDVGRKTRTIPTAIRRALVARDRHCQFPGCTARRCDGHHIQHWIDGGPTRLDNLTLLCRCHHRAVHKGGFTMARCDNGAPVFYRPDGTCVEVAPRTHDRDADPSTPTHADSIVVGPCTAMTRGDDAPLDVGWAIDILRDSLVRHRAAHECGVPDHIRNVTWTPLRASIVPRLSALQVTASE